VQGESVQDQKVMKRRDTYPQNMVELELKKTSLQFLDLLAQVSHIIMLNTPDILNLFQKLNVLLRVQN
jgi:hypothetical protein